jgi:hypothetical protein
MGSLEKSTTGARLPEYFRCKYSESVNFVDYQADENDAPLPRIKHGNATSAEA